MDIIILALLLTAVVLVVRESHEPGLWSRGCWHWY